MDVDLFKKKCAELRKSLLRISFTAKTNHIGCNLSIVELMTSLFYSVLKISPSTFKTWERDYFILSKGHASLIYYIILSDIGCFPFQKIENEWHRNNGTLCEHPMISTEGVDVSTGSLGHGLSIGAGIALGLQNKKNRVFVLLGDGECNEGSIWEAAAFASSNNLSNLCAIIDHNNIQGLGFVDKIMSSNFAEKFAAFGWDTAVVNGHDCASLVNALSSVPHSNKPVAIIAQTIKGAGISFMENQVKWHYKSMSENEYLDAMKEVEALA